MRLKSVLTNFVILLVSLLILLVSSNIVINQVTQKNADNEIINYLDIATQVYDGTNVDATAKALTNGNDDIRITFIDKDSYAVIKDVGNIVEDSVTYDSHADRPEIQHLGQVFRRKSKSLNLTLFYVAALDDGVYIRISIPVESVDHIIGIFDLVAVFVVLLILIIATIAFIITSKNSLKPINEQVKKLGEIVHDDSIYDEDSIKELSTRVEKVRVLINQKMDEINGEKDKVNYIINNIDQGLIILDGSLKLMLINQLASDLFEMKSEDVVGKDAVFLFRDEEMLQIANDVLEKDISLSREFIIQDKTYLLNFNQIKNDWSKSDSKFGVAILMIDESKLSQVETMKKDFFTNASHELKSPLTTIIGYLQMLDQGIFDNKDKENEAVKESIKEAKRMGKVISDMLELSYLESDNPKQMDNISIDELIQDTLASEKKQIEEKKIKVKLKLEKYSCLMNLTDAQYLIGNIIDNAIKYNKEKGKINVSLKNKVMIIEDTGIGIPSEDLDRIFERFYRVSKSRSRELGGTGLGLSIVKHICNNYGLVLNIESKVNVGTKFTITFK